jgi:hypothetical protein
MSQPSRPRDRSQASRRRPQWKNRALESLETRALLAPVLSTTTSTATFTVVTQTPANPNVTTGTVTVAQGAATGSAAPTTSVSLLTGLDQFGGDMVRIEAGQGGDFGKAVYAISRGAGSNPNAVNRPGTIYRVDPATGKASVFFDLNPVIQQLENDTSATAANGLGSGTGYTNWYDIAFDPEGYFDGRPSMFVSSISSTDPNKNAVFRIGSNGDFLGVYIGFSATAGAGLSRTPTVVMVPPVEQQKFFRGLFTGEGTSDATGNRPVLFFDANFFRPGTDLNSATGLPTGVTQTALTLGPQTGLTSVNSYYSSRNALTGGSPSQVYGTFTDFGKPPAPGVPGTPGPGGVQGINGDLLINLGVQPAVASTAIDTYPSNIFSQPNVVGLNGLSAFRRFQDTTFDYYGYFSYGFASTATGGFTAASLQAPTYVGSMFVSDLATGLAVSVPRPANAPVGPNIVVPINTLSPGPFTITVTFDPATGLFTVANPTVGGNNNSGRVVRISPSGVVTNFAQNFDVSGAQDFSSFDNSSLSVTFSADGTTMYATDNDGIWQFKSVLSLAGSSTGNVIGLNDLRALGVPYEGQDSSVAVLDTGIDATNPAFRGRVATGYNAIYSNQDGHLHSIPFYQRANDDLAPAGSTTTGLPDGHGTLVAGVVAQFVPQATLLPVSVFPAANTNTTNFALYNGLTYLSRNPFTPDPVRPNKQDRVISTTIGFGSTQTFITEGIAYRLSKQLTIAFKGRLGQMRKLGNQPIAAAGNVGDPNGMSVPAIYNEVISVTGTYPFPFQQDATTPPIDPTAGVIPRPVGPILLFPNQDNVLTANGGLNAFAALDVGVFFNDKLVNQASKAITTDFAAPAINVPTFKRTTSPTATTIGGNTFYASGTSLSAGIVAGSYATVESALDYWTDIARTGVTSDAYLNVPVGTRTLNFGAHQLLDLSVYANPDGINSILQWTAVPIDATDIPGYTTIANRQLWNPDGNGRIRGANRFPQYSRIDIGNAIASIEGAEALNWLVDHNMLAAIDGNSNGLITAQEIQTFVDKANTIGLPEAGAMARLLGGTARISATFAGLTAFGEQPDSPDVLQRRFNYLDYAAHGTLTGAISVDEMKMLAHTLLPPPDSFVVVDRQRSSANGYLLDPDPIRNYIDLRHLLPLYAWAPPSAVKRFKNVSPAMFGVNRGSLGVPGPYTFTLFSNEVQKQPAAPKAKPAKAAAKPAATAPTTAATPTPTPTSTTTTDPTATTSTTTSTSTPTTTTTSTPTTTTATTTTTTSTSTPTTTTSSGSGATTTPPVAISSTSNSTSTQSLSTREQAALDLARGLAGLAQLNGTTPGTPQVAGTLTPVSTSSTDASAQSSTSTSATTPTNTSVTTPTSTSAASSTNTTTTSTTSTKSSTTAATSTTKTDAAVATTSTSTAVTHKAATKKAAPAATHPAKKVVAPKPKKSDNIFKSLNPANWFK